MIGAILSQWRAVVYGLLAAGFIIAGWTVNQWRVDASQLKATQAALKFEMAARVKADADRVNLGMQLSEKEAQIAATSNQAKTVIREYVTKDPRCNLEPALVRVLRDARAGRVPPTADSPASAGGATTAAPAG